MSKITLHIVNIGNQDFIASGIISDNFIIGYFIIFLYANYCSYIFLAS